jgi:S1-C subfamily serine protease
MKRRLGWLAGIAILLSSLACQATLVKPGSPTATALPFSNVVQPSPFPTSTLPAAPEITGNNTISPQTAVDAQSELISLYQKVSPGVVAIQITTDQGAGLGSGFVYDSQGHIITNFHVVDGAKTIEVDFPSGYKTTAKVIGTDLDSDLAVIKVDAPASELKPLALGDSDQLQVGMTAVAIGNPFGLNSTMTVGIISALGRTLESERQAPQGNFFTAGDIIQTDAAINPGNSGGPLLNLQGEVIGINRAIQTDTSTTTGEPVNSGIGFAISINIVKRVVPALIANGKYDYPYLGITSQSDLSLAEIQALGLKQTTGAYVVAVTKGGPADKAGLIGGSQPTDIPNLEAGGDLITAVDGHQVLVFGDLLSYLINNKAPGDTVVLTIIRDNQQKEVTLTLGKRP